MMQVMLIASLVLMETTMWCVLPSSSLLTTYVMLVNVLVMTDICGISGVVTMITRPRNPVYANSQGEEIWHCSK